LSQLTVIKTGFKALIVIVQVLIKVVRKMFPFFSVLSLGFLFLFLLEFHKMLMPVEIFKEKQEKNNTSCDDGSGYFH